MCAGTPDFFIFVRFAGHRNYWKYLYVGNMDELFKDKLIAEKITKKRFSLYVERRLDSIGLREKFTTVL